MKRPELLAPAGSMTMLRAAVDAGADAVYLGLNQYNARIHAANFTLEDLSEALEYAHLRNSKVYITLNTLIEDDEMMDAVELALSAYKLGADAFLIQDRGLAAYLSEHFPQIPLHASTQMNVFAKDQVEEMKALSMERVVLPRELSVEEIRSRVQLLHKEGIEAEVFVHGAMCVCYSGLCLFSSMNKSGSRSGNRGACAQPCRQSYQLFDGNRQVAADGKALLEGKLLSPKDQSALPYLRELMENGVDSLKIEGRMRDENYCAAVVYAYRRMIDAILQNKDTKEVLDQVQNDLLVTFNRGGAFTTQYLQGKKGPDYLSGEYAGKYGLYWGEILSLNAKAGTICIRSWQSDVPEKGDYLSIRDKENEIASFPVGKIEVSMNSALVKGLHPDAIAKLHQGMAVYRMSKQIEIPKDKLRKTPVRGIFSLNEDTYSLKVEVSEGANKGICAAIEIPKTDLGEGEPLTWERTKEQLQKTGQTPFTFVSIKQDGDFPIYLRISEINALRRDLMARLAEAVLDASTRGRKDEYVEGAQMGRNDRQAPEKMHVTIADFIDLNRITDGYACGADIYLFSALAVTRPGRIAHIDALLSEEPDAKIALRLPGAYKDDLETAIEKAVSLLKSHAGSRFLGCFGTNLNEKIVGLLGGGNVYNHFTYNYEAKENISFLYPSYELSEEQILKMAASLDETSKTVYMALHRYGPIEWMQSEFCPLGRHQKNCSMCTSHPQVSLGEKKMEKNALHNDSRVDVVCYPGFCRADLFGEAKFIIGSATRQKLEKMKIPTASVVRFMDEDQGERRMIVESLLDYDDPYEEEEDWYEY
ncbi:MAG: U32 family peptidase [Clostridiales bacterium]|nr:U32 family peptidase [Clostridiales bacterium]